MYDPNDDTDVTSGTTDGAQMERTSPPVRRQEGDDGPGPAGGEGTSEGRGAGAGKGKGKGKGKAAGAPRQGDSEAARRIDALEAGDYGGAGPEEEEEDLAERFTRCLLEDASGGY